MLLVATTLMVVFPSAPQESTPYQYSVDGGANYQVSNIFTGLLPGSYS